jgi:magnesium transporter
LEFDSISDTLFCFVILFCIPYNIFLLHYSIVSDSSVNYKICDIIKVIGNIHDIEDDVFDEHLAIAKEISLIRREITILRRTIFPLRE